MPERNATGTNTAISTSEVAITAPATSPIARPAAAWASPCVSPRLRAMFSTTTIASSTTSPVASTIPNSVSVLIEKPNALMKAKVPISDTGMVTLGMTVARQSWRKRKMTTMTSTIASSSVFTTSRIDSRTAVVGLKAISYFIDGGKLTAQPAQRRADGGLQLQGVGVGLLKHAHADGVAAVEAEVQGIVLGAQLRACRRRAAAPAPPLALRLSTSCSNSRGSVSRPATRDADLEGLPRRRRGAARPAPPR